MTLHNFMLHTSYSEHIILTVHTKDKEFGAVLGVPEYFHQPDNIFREKYSNWKVHGIRVQNSMLRIDLRDK